jgi:hypothetical protein
MSQARKTATMIRRALFAVLLVFAVGLPAFAHRVGVPTTLIEQNPVSGVWEITHRVSAHDFDEVFAGLINPVQLYSSSQGQKLIETYVGERFKVEGELVALSYIGAELDGDFVFIYSELETESMTVTVDNQLLLDLPGISEAFINVKAGEGVHTAQFFENSGPVVVSLPTHQAQSDLLP